MAAGAREVGTVKGYLAAGTLLFGGLAVAAAVSYLNGNPTAINGVIGAGFVAAFFALLWIIEETS